jgi:hypothetical protein
MYLERFYNRLTELSDAEKQAFMNEIEKQWNASSTQEMLQWRQTRLNQVMLDLKDILREIKVSSISTLDTFNRRLKCWLDEAYCNQRVMKRGPSSFQHGVNIAERVARSSIFDGLGRAFVEMFEAILLFLGKFLRAFWKIIW